LTDLAFYDCPELAVIIGDFSKGLGATMAAKATIDLGLTTVTDEALIYLDDRDKEILEAAEVVVAEEAGRPQQILLQLCEWHTISTIKRRLVVVRKYPKDYRDELISMI
jgi:hypothetical protein